MGEQKPKENNVNRRTRIPGEQGKVVSKNTEGTILKGEQGQEENNIIW